MQQGGIFRSWNGCFRPNGIVGITANNALLAKALNTVLGPMASHIRVGWLAAGGRPTVHQLHLIPCIVSAIDPLLIIGLQDYPPAWHNHLGTGHSWCGKAQAAIGPVSRFGGDNLKGIGREAGAADGIPNDGVVYGLRQGRDLGDLASSRLPPWLLRPTWLRGRQQQQTGHR
jgi:hypothetical protein